MAATAFSKPVQDSVAKVDGEVAVGENLEFQRKWWRFERFTWSFFALLIALDLAGAFGRGPLAHARRQAEDGSIDLHYDRIERATTPSIIEVSFGSSAVKNGKVELFASESLVKTLGAQRVIPAPESTSVGNGGLTYTFAASQLPASVEFALEPQGPGINHLTLQVPGAQPVTADIVVLP